MSHKSRVNFGTTIAALFAISIFVYAGDAKADRDYPDFIANFYPDFVANLDAEQVPDEPGDPGFSSQSVASGKAKFWLNNDRTELHYEIKLKHIDLVKTGTTEAVTKIHL